MCYGTGQIMCSQQEYPVCLTSLTTRSTIAAAFCRCIIGSGTFVTPRSDPANQGFEISGGSPQDVAQFMRTEIEKWTRVVDGAGQPKP